MELTSQSVREVAFGQKVRGYDPNDVDDFIDQVAEGVDELHEKLRQANERAAAAEAGGGSVAAAPAVTSASDIGKVWERAAAAAESAVEEARQEAARILEEARSNAAAAEAAVEEARLEASRVKEDARNQARHESDQTLQSARQEAETTLNSARSESEQTLQSARQEAEEAINSARQEADQTRGSARAEVARLAEESQGELRQELAQLQETRDILQGNVQALSAYLDAELEKVRSALRQSLSAIENSALGDTPAPSVQDVNVPESRYGVGAAVIASSSPAPAYSEPTYQETSYQEPSQEEFAAVEDLPVSSETQYDQPAYDNTGYDAPQAEESPVTDEAETNWGNRGAESADQGAASWESEATNNVDREPQEDAAWPPAETNQNPGYTQAEDEDDDVDPFLAELRRAVHDEGPLGPRDGQNDDTSIDSLYSDDEDDKNGFFRRKR